MAALTGRSLVVSIGGTDYSSQVFNFEVQADAADDKDVTFAEAAAGGGRVYNLAIKLTQDMATGTLWDKIWTAAGTDVPILLKPYGNAAPSATQPHYTAIATVKEPDGVLIGGDADASPTKRNTIEVEWPLVANATNTNGKPVKVIA